MLQLRQTKWALQRELTTRLISKEQPQLSNGPVRIFLVQPGGFPASHRPPISTETMPVLYIEFFAHDEVNVHCSPAKEVFFHNSQLDNERLLENSQNPREIRTCSLPIARHKR